MVQRGCLSFLKSSVFILRFIYKVGLTPNRQLQVMILFSGDISPNKWECDFVRQIALTMSVVAMGL
jgi:hypothetical protein